MTAIVIFSSKTKTKPSFLLLLFSNCSKQMPLLGKEPFIRQELPEDTSPDEQVFVCKATNEAFLTYDQFFERQILCSSMVWTCSVTNRTGLTYEEAVQSERNASETLNSFPIGLQIPILYLMNYINESKIGSIIDLIHSYIFNRYFIAEDIDLMINIKKKLSGKVFRVIPPSNTTQRTDGLNIDPKLYEYEIIDNNKDRHIVSCARITRSKGVLSKDKIRLFLKQHLTATKRFQPMTVKDSSKRRFCLNNIQWNQMFGGPEPVFPTQASALESKPIPSPSTSNSSKTQTKQKSEKSVENKAIDSKNRSEAQNNSSQDKQKLKENERLEKEKEKELKKEWSLKRDDLACDDLKPLPEPVPLKCQIPTELFADCVFVMEFIHNFNDLIDIKSIFPFGITFELMEQILFDIDIDGPFVDLIKVLLTTNFTLEDEDNSTETDDITDDEDIQTREEEKTDKSLDVNSSQNSNLMNPIHCYQWIQSHLGLKLSKISLDAFTITEVLRLHLMSSSGEPESKSKFRGLYHSREDPAIEFVAENEVILEKLEFKSVFDLKADERIKIFNVLILQLLSYFEFRYKIDNSFDEMTKLRKKIRDIQIEFNKWVKDNKPVNKKDSQNDSQKSNASNVTTVSMTEELNEFNREKSFKEEDKYRTLNEIRTQIFKLQSSYCLKPIGTDRSFRKYWVFESLPGLFVEHMKPNTSYTSIPFGPCLPEPTPIKTFKTNCFEDCPQRDDSSTTSDKENEVNSLPNNYNEDNGFECLKESYRSNNLSHFDKCTANINTCCVHGMSAVHEIIEWTFYYSSEHLNSLIDSLNDRGFRESQLICALNRDKNSILDYMSRCQPYKLNQDIPAPEARRSQRLVEVFHSRKRKQSSSRLTFNEEIEVNLKEDLLILEEKLFAASLAVQTELSRNEWRKSVEQQTLNKTQLIENISKAILALKQSIRSMCLSLPLSDEITFQNWSKSLCESRSLSQLFVHLSVLDDSIKWSKSAREAYCKICRRKCDAQNMLLCDQCNRGHHTYCLQPSLDAIPLGEWFCPDCSPKFKPLTPKKDKSFLKIDSDSDYNTSDDEYINQSGSDSISDRHTKTPSQEVNICGNCHQEDIESELSCAKCHQFFHLNCVNVRRIPRFEWFCPKCQNKSNEKKRKNTVYIDFNENTNSEESNQSFIDSKRSRYSQDSDYINSKSMDNKELEEVEEQIQKFTTNTSLRRRLERNGITGRRSLPLDFSLCDDILKRLQKHGNGWLFMSRPNHAPKYNQIIKQYMDFGQLVSKLNTGVYTSNIQFFRDVLLMLNNATFYNPMDSEEYNSCQSLAQYFQTLLEEYGIDLNN